jgi:hypothetical protein
MSVFKVDLQNGGTPGEPFAFSSKNQFWSINSLCTEWARQNGLKSLCETSSGFLRPFLQFVCGAILKWVIVESDGRGLRVRLEGMGK